LWEELSGKARKIREVLQEDPAFINFIWSAPADADWKDEKVWRDSKPAMGDFLRLASVRAACESAKSSPSEENTCRRLRLNQGCSSRTGSSRRRCGMRRRSGGGVHSVGSYRPARGLELLSDAERETAELVAAFRILPHGSFRRHHGSSDGKRRLPAYEIWQVADAWKAKNKAQKEAAVPSANRSGAAAAGDTPEAAGRGRVGTAATMELRHDHVLRVCEGAARSGQEERRRQGDEDRRGGA
jgi:hypothetical protein